jgi:hypothetical protein
VAILEGPLLLGFAPEDLVIPIRVEWWVDVDEIHASVRQRLKPVEAIPTVNNPSIYE